MSTKARQQKRRERDSRNAANNKPLVVKQVTLKSVEDLTKVLNKASYEPITAASIANSIGGMKGTATFVSSTSFKFEAENNHNPTLFLLPNESIQKEPVKNEKLVKEPAKKAVSKKK